MKYPIENPMRGWLSTPQAIADTLKRAIIDGKLLAGESLREEELAHQFEVSRIPVREALRQLESQGWIVHLRNRGAFVAPLTVEEVREIYDILAALECMALRLAVPRHTPESLRKAEATLYAAGNSPEHVDRNRNFHHALCEPADRPRVMNLIVAERDRAQRYLRLYLAMPRYGRKTEREHLHILRACRRGDITGAVQLLQDHLLETGEMLTRYLEQHIRKSGSDPGKALVALQQQAIVSDGRSARAEAKGARRAQKAGV